MRAEPRRRLSALSLDALSSVAYGPQAMMLVLILAGTGALRFTLPLTLVITAMLVLLVDLLHAGDRRSPRGRRRLRGGQGEPRPRRRACSRRPRWSSTTCSPSPSASPPARPASGACFPGLAHHLLLVSPDRPGAADGGQHVRDHRVGPAADGADAALHREHRRGDRRRPVPSPPGRGDRHQAGVPGHRDARHRAAAQGVRGRVLGSHRRRGDRQRRAGSSASHASGPRSARRSRSACCSG